MWFRACQHVFKFCWHLSKSLYPHQLMSIQLTKTTHAISHLNTFTIHCKIHNDQDFLCMYLMFHFMYMGFCSEGFKALLRVFAWCLVSRNIKETSGMTTLFNAIICYPGSHNGPNSPFVFFQLVPTLSSATTLGKLGCSRKTWVE
jgi:hypothetical protein